MIKSVVLSRTKSLFPADFLMRARRISLVTIFLVAATTIAYSRVFSCGFVGFDDPFYVYSNSNVLSGISWSGIKYAFQTLDCSNWHPLTWISLELDATIWRDNPFGYHLTNVGLHTLNTVLTFLVLCQMTNRIVRSLCVALLFSLHPLHVESVAWISERKDVLSTFFC